MGLFSETFSKKNIYSIVTVVVIILLTAGYLIFVLPSNEKKEDAKNQAILKGIEKQLNEYIDDQIKYISEDKIKSLGLSVYKGSSTNYIDTITIDKAGTNDLQQGTIKLARKIRIAGPPKIYDKDKNPKVKFNDTIYIDLGKFLNKISATTPFTSFYICPVEAGGCKAEKMFLSKDVTLIDQDSLILYGKNNGPFNFKKSVKRYYANQINIPQTTHTLFLAAGIEKSYFQANVRQINTNLLIFSLIFIILVVLGINFIKPIVSSYKEILSQIDLVGVVFASGLLIAVLVVFGTLSYWNIAVKNRTENDLKELVNKIDKSFTQQIATYQNWKNKGSLFEEIEGNSEKLFGKIYLKADTKVTSLDGRSITKNESLAFQKPKNITWHKFDLKKGTKNSELLKYLDSYFRMDNKGLITTNLSNTYPDIPRKYADRMYFKILQKKRNNQKTNPVLTAVFSREDNKYQLIYAEKDTIDEKNPKSENNGISGIAFREYFSEELELPPGTSYMLIDRRGEVLMQKDAGKNLYQNLLYGSQNNSKLLDLLSGVTPLSFEIEYQGTPYQIYAKKLGVKSNSPVYILGIRDLSHLNRLSLFTFTNGFLVSIFYGFCLLLITYIYSALFYSGRVSMFSRQHFHHLFPDNSRTDEYKLLLFVSGIAILLATVVSFITSPSIALVFCITLGINVVIVNFLTLSIRSLEPKKELIKLLLIIFFAGLCLPLILFFNNLLLFAVIALFGTHIGLIFHHRNWKKEKTDLEPFAKKNLGVNKKAYTRFLTARLMHQFVVFPFVLISAYYVNELNYFAKYYCSYLQTKEQDIKDKNAFIIKDRITYAYNCNCDEKSTEKPPIVLNNKNEIVQKANLGFLDRPATYEIKNFTFNKLSSNYYINSLAIILYKGNNLFSFLIFLSLLLGFCFLAILAYQLLNFYSNRFFFYDLMHAAHKKYYPCTKHLLANDHIFIPMINNDDIENLIQVNNNTPLATCPDRKITIDDLFKDGKNEDVKKNEISPYLRMNFILNYHNKQLAKEYNSIWDSLPNDETRYVLFDFAQDQFANYKNKDIIISLMESGIIDCHKLTGRLQLMNLSFRKFIMSKRKSDPNFIQSFDNETTNGTFSKVRFPLIVIAVSALLLLMYLNKDSYDRVSVIGGSIIAVLTLINKFIDPKTT
ncbi:cache domain-containing protein [Flavobacterium sp. HTF]|uniref:cache domain-containing protein n=1 Tax=Flavobacterium sp. HTF TaxID=2170732 RepID=UPI000D5E2A2C|nr:cache domain-containing protein [Flavobacterium sp. HTF]PWB26032.1 hypothetical protein DCO46_07325 [Flavobacterium sp. HTF]